MRTSARGIGLIKGFERLMLFAYEDGAGVATIGYGHTRGVTHADVTNHRTITESQAESMLEQDLASAEDAVTRYVHVQLAQNEFDALVSFTFNLGDGSLAQSTILHELNQGHKPASAKAFSLWNKMRVKGELTFSNGLLARRMSEMFLFLGLE